MPKLPLTGGAYQARSIIADAQRCINLYPEICPQGAPFPFTHYPTPGLTLWTKLPTYPLRGMYLATNGDFYAVAGNAVYLIPSQNVFTKLGTIDTGITPVSMVDNGNVLCIVDGTANGYVVDLGTHKFTQIINPAFYGATSVGYVDTYFVFNRPGTNQFYITYSNLDFSQAIGGPIQSGVIAGGANYQNGTFTNIPLTGGSGSGALATVTVAGNIVTVVNITNPGINYITGDVLTAALAGAGIITGISAGSGSNIVNGTYPATATTTTGSGTGATVTFVVTMHHVTSATLVNPGLNYAVGDGLGAELQAFPIDGTTNPAGVTVTSIAGASGGFKYTVTAGSTSFNSLDIAAKTGFPDNLANIAVIHREIWLIGQKTTEVWYNTGAADFTFGIMPGVFIQHGCIAPYSLAKQDLNLFFLSNDDQGQAIVVMGDSYSLVRISTHAIEASIQAYSTVADAVGFTYQQGGHVFYVLNFPTGNATWVYDVTTKLWHQRCSININGSLNRHLPNVACAAFGFNLCGDYSSGNIYYYDQANYTDNAATVPRIRSFPHLQNEDKRVGYRSFIADMEVGNYPGILTPTGTLPVPPQVSLRWSDDRGESYSNAVEQSLGAGGQYRTSVKWNRLGMARDRVFELSWSANVKTALNGAYVEVTPFGS